MSKTTREQVNRKAEFVTKQTGVKFEVSNYGKWKSVHINGGNRIATVGTYHDVWQVIDVYYNAFLAGRESNA